MTDRRHCACGHEWDAPLVPATLGTGGRAGDYRLREGADVCPVCGLVGVTVAYCWVCEGDAPPLTPERVHEIARASERPGQLWGPDFLCKAHEEVGAGADVRPCELEEALA